MPRRPFFLSFALRRVTHARERERGREMRSRAQQQQRSRRKAEQKVTLRGLLNSVLPIVTSPFPPPPYHHAIDHALVQPARSIIQKRIASHLPRLSHSAQLWQRSACGTTSDDDDDDDDAPPPLSIPGPEAASRAPRSLLSSRLLNTAVANMPPKDAAAAAAAAKDANAGPIQLENTAKRDSSKSSNPSRRRTGSSTTSLTSTHPPRMTAS